MRVSSFCDSFLNNGTTTTTSSISSPFNNNANGNNININIAFGKCNSSSKPYSIIVQSLRWYSSWTAKFDKKSTLFKLIIPILLFIVWLIENCFDWYLCYAVTNEEKIAFTRQWFDNGINVFEYGIEFIVSIEGYSIFIFCGGKYRIFL